MSSVPSGVTIMWPGTNASIPTGWTRVTQMDSTYPKGTAAGVDPDVTGGATTHTHVDPGHSHTLAGHTHGGTASGNDTDPGTTVGVGFTAVARPHTHTAPTAGSISSTSSTDAGTWGTGSNDPSFLRVIYIASDGTPTGFPANSWALWDKVASLPTGWSNPAAARSVFLQGATAAGDGGGTGGGGAHTHTAVAHGHASITAHTHGGGNSGVPSASSNTNSGGGLPLSNHTHPVTYTSTASSPSIGNGTDSASGGTTYEPAYNSLLVVQNDTAGQDMQLRHVAMWRGLLSNIPPGWVLCDGTNSTVDMRGQHLKGAANLAGIGTTGGNNGHSHTAGSGHTHTQSHVHAQQFAIDTGNGGGTAGGASAVPSGNHVHTSSNTSADTTSFSSTAQTAPTTADTQPPFRTVAFIALSASLSVSVTDPTASEVITAPATNIAWSMTGGTGVQNDYRYKVYESDGSTVHYDSGQIASAASSTTLSALANLLNLTSYYMEVTVHDTTAGTPLTSVSAKVAFSTSWSPPPTITGLRAYAETEERI